MFTEKHILTNPYNHHKLSRIVTGYDLSAVDCIPSVNSGYSGTIVNLTPMSASRFLNWDITGATITGSAFAFGNEDVTAKGNYKLPTILLGANTATVGPNAGTLSLTANNTPISSLDYDIICLKFEAYNMVYTWSNYTQGIYYISDGKDTTTRLVPPMPVYNPGRCPVAYEYRTAHKIRSTYKCEAGGSHPNAYESTANGFQNTWAHYRMILDYNHCSGRTDALDANAYATYTWTGNTNKVRGITCHTNGSDATYQQMGLRNLTMYNCETWADALAL